MELSVIILITTGLGLLALVARSLCSRWSIPYTVLLVVLGIIMGWLSQGFTNLQAIRSLQLTPEMVFFVFLPVLIFESAFNLNVRELLRCLAPILTMAIPALLLSTLIVGLGLHWLLGMHLIEALLFGALISATDPVAVVALFRELGAPARLTMLVEGESLFNDAVAIVLFNILLGLSMGGGLDWTSLGYAGYEFLRVFLGGLLAGGIAGLLVCELFHLLREKSGTMMLVSVCMAWLVFAVAEHVLHVSGVMAVLAAALAMSFTMLVRSSHAAGQTMIDSWELIAIAGNCLLFLLVGLAVDLGRLVHHLPLIAAAVLLVLLGRAAAVYLLLPLVTRLFSLPAASSAEQHIIWWGGLKGALALAIALSVPHALASRELIIDMTVGVVLFFLLVNGTTIQWLMRHLGLACITREELAEQRHTLSVLREHSEGVLLRLGTVGVLKDADGVRTRIHSAFHLQEPDLDDNPVEALRLPLLRAESLEYHLVYNMGLINTYTYLELCGDIYARRGTQYAAHRSPRAAGHFLSLEHTLLGRLRESDLAAALLRRYQDFRLANAISRSIALILGYRKALEVLAEEADMQSFHAGLEAEYQQRIEIQLHELQVIAEGFPDYYHPLVEHLACRMALGAARNQLEEEHHRGMLGVRNYVLLDWRLQEVLRPLLAADAVRLHHAAGALLEGVPLLGGLPQDALQQLAACARIMHFLQGDEITHSGAHGDAMYIIHSGQVGIYRGDPERQVGSLRRGDFFGEIALLGEQVRTATARAEALSVLLRLQRRDVLRIAGEFSLLGQRLRQATQERSR